MKRWPVGSLAQSAIQAALAAREKAGDVAQVKQVRVFAEEGAYDHLVRIRKALGRRSRARPRTIRCPISSRPRCSTAYVRTDSFDPSRVLDPARQRFLEENVWS